MDTKMMEKVAKRDDAYNKKELSQHSSLKNAV